MPKKTLIFFDEVQAFPKVLTYLKFFKEQGDYDVICSGSLLGINYQNITSVSVGFKTDYIMYSLDFEEFLWVKGYKDEDIQYFFSFTKKLKPLPNSILIKLNDLLTGYIYCDGMIDQVNTYIKQGNFINIFKKQEQLYRDYEEDITKYVVGLNASRIKIFLYILPLNLLKKITSSNLEKLLYRARYREYRGCEGW